MTNFGDKTHELDLPYAALNAQSFTLHPVQEAIVLPKRGLLGVLHHLPSLLVPDRRRLLVTY